MMTKWLPIFRNHVWSQITSCKKVCWIKPRFVMKVHDQVKTLIGNRFEELVQVWRGREATCLFLVHFFIEFLFYIYFLTYFFWRFYVIWLNIEVVGKLLSSFSYCVLYQSCQFVQELTVWLFILCTVVLLFIKAF